MDLVYGSQDERKMARLWRKQRKLELKLAERWRRPRGMHWGTFRTIATKLNATLERQERLFCAGARALLERRAVR
jgi:hypothetical protein